MDGKNISVRGWENKVNLYVNTPLFGDFCRRSISSYIRLDFRVWFIHGKNIKGLKT